VRASTQQAHGIWRIHDNPTTIADQNGDGEAATVSAELNSRSSRSCQAPNYHLGYAMFKMRRRNNQRSP
jgi:hypothetical protein